MLLYEVVLDRYILSDPNSQEPKMLDLASLQLHMASSCSMIGQEINWPPASPRDSYQKLCSKYYMCANVNIHILFPFSQQSTDNFHITNRTGNNGQDLKKKRIYLTQAENYMKSSALSTTSQQADMKIIAIPYFKQHIHSLHTEIVVQKRLSIH